MKKRILSFFLALVMLFSCMSLNIFATEGTGAAGAEGETVVSNTLAAHTDAQMKAALASLTTAKDANGNPKYSWGDGTTYRQNNDSYRLQYTDDGRLVVGARVVPAGKKTPTSNQSYMQMANHTNWAGRDLVLGYANHYAKGKAFVASTDIEFTDEYLKNTNNIAIPVVQIAVYQSTDGRDGKNPNQLGTYMPNILYVQPNGDNITVLVAPNGDTANLIPIGTVEANKSHTMAVHVDPQAIDEEAGRYGTFKVYVNGEQMGVEYSFMTKSQSDKLAFSTTNPVAYFVDSSYDGYTTFKGGQAYFFLPVGTVLDDKTDTDEDGIPDLYEGVQGITAETAAKITGYTCIGTSSGVTDMCVGFIRIFQVSESSKVLWEKDAVYFDNLAVFYSDEYVDVTDHNLQAEAHAHDFTKDTLDVKYTCSICDGYILKTEALDANGDRVCDICLPELDSGLGVLDVESVKQYASNVTYISNNGKFANMDYNGGAMILVTDENGNSYIKFGINDDGAPITLSKNTYGQTGYSGLEWPYQVDTVKRFEELKGKSYVVSIDYKMLGKLPATTPFVLIKSYLKYNAGSSSLSDFDFVPASITPDGDIVYRNLAEGKAECPTGVNINDGEFHTIAFHHTPKGDANSPVNTFDLYIDGKLVVNNAKALSDAEAAFMTVENGKLNPHVSGTTQYPYSAETITLNGPQDYIPAVLRTVQYSEKTVIDKDLFAIDNVKVYNTDSFFEHTHTYKMTHAHNVSDSENTITYTCCVCGHEETFVQPMHASVETKNTLTPAELAATDAKVIIANDLNSFTLNKAGSHDVVSGVLRVCTHWGSVVTKTDSTGNTFLKWGAKTTNGSDTNYAQVMTGYNNWDKMKSLIEANDPIVGAPYVVSIDFMHYGLQDLNAIGQIASYTNKVGGNSKTVSFTPVSVSSGGVLRYSNAGTTTPTDVVLKPGQFYNIVMQHTPANNTYDVYVDGKLVVNDALALNQANTDAANGGYKTFTPGFIRTHTLGDYSGEDLFGIDNIKMYFSSKNYECGHSFVKGVCEWCGEKDADFDHCEICNGTAISANAAVVSKSASLGEMINMNVYMALSEKLVKTEGAKVTLNCGNRSAEYALADAVKEANGLYKFSIELRSTQMASDVEVKVVGETSDTYKTSIKAYAEELIETSDNAAAVSLAKAMLNYGAAAQKYFAVKNTDAALDDVLANAGLAEADQAIPDAAKLPMFGMLTFGQNIAGEGVEFTAATIMFSAKTHVKVYFTASENATVTVDGKQATAVKEDDGYYVAFTLESPTELTVNKTIAVTDGENSATTSISVGLLLKLGAEATESENFKALLGAYAGYALCAQDYLYSIGA